jgi:hypothetical protein
VKKQQRDDTLGLVETDVSSAGILISEGEAMTFDAATLADEFRLANLVASQRARWCADDPGAEPNTCRYCGRHWRRWAGSKLDGHAACIVTEDFKLHLCVLLRSPRVTYQAIAGAIGVTPAVVRSWTFPIRTVRRAA